MSKPQSTDTRRDRDIKSGAHHTKHRSAHREKACPNPPASPTPVTLSFQVTEDRTQLNFAPKVSWGAVTRDDQGHKIDIHQYVVQMMATDGHGNAVELEDGKPRIRELHKNIPKSADIQDDYFVVYPEVPRPKTWYWQARVAAVDEKGCQGDFGPTPPLGWTAEKLPWQTDAGRGAVPTPTGVTLLFDTFERGRHDRYRAVVVWNEITNWDIPGGDHNDDMAAYEVELQSGTNTYPPGPTTNWNDATNPKRSRVKSAKDSDTDTTAQTAFKNIHPHYYYRVRVRAIDRFNRRGNWSNWAPNDSPGVTPSDSGAPPVPTNVDLNMNSHQARITWDEQIDASTGILHQDVAFFRVQMSKNSGFSTINYKDDFVTTQHKVFKLDKPKGTWFARVAAVDAAGNGKNNWSTLASDTPRKPPAVPNVRVDFILQEPKKWNKVKARVRWDGVQEQSDDIAFYVVELESGDVVGGDPQNTYTKDGNRWKGHVKAAEVTDDTGILEATETAYAPDATDRRLQWMHDAKRGHFYRARVRAVDKDGQAGDYGPNPPQGWTNGTKCSPANARVLKKPTNVTSVVSTKGVGIRWTHPIDSDNLPDQTIDYFRVMAALTAPPTAPNSDWSPTLVLEDDIVHGRRAVYNASEWVNTAGPYYLAVQSVDEMNNTSDWSYPVDASGNPATVSPGTAGVGPGDINDPSLFSTTIPVIVSRSTLPVLPDANFPGGSQVWLTADFTDAAGKLFVKRKFYKNKAGAWTAEIFAVDLGDSVQAANIAADAVRAVHIRAGEITGDHLNANVATAATFVLRNAGGTGGAFRTDTVNSPRIEMSQVDGPDRIAFVNAAANVGGALGRVFLAPTSDTPSGGTRADLVDLVVWGQSPSQVNSGLRWGNTASNGAANSRLLNNGAIQLGANLLAVGTPDSGTCRLFWNPQANSGAGALQIKKPNGNVLTVTVT